LKIRPLKFQLLPNLQQRYEEMDVGRYGIIIHIIHHIVKYGTKVLIVSKELAAIELGIVAVADSHSFA
jgi:hypothetical protein